MSEHLPECEMISPQCAGRSSGESHRGVMFCLHCHRRCLCSALRACEQRVLGAARKALNTAERRLHFDGEANRWIVEIHALDAIDSLRGES